MRIAICLSGQPRWYKECSPYIKKNVLDNFQNADVFIHAWNSKSGSYECSIKGIDTGYVEEDVVNSLISHYSPKDIVVEDPIIFQDSISYPYPIPDNWPANNVFSMFYSMKKCIDLKKEQEDRLGRKYDWVFRTRFDYAINRNFTEAVLRSLDESTLYSPHVVKTGNIHCHGDFNFGTSKVIDCLGATFDNLMEYGKKSVALAVESMTYTQVAEGGYAIEEFDLLNQFPPSQHSACWHSLWGHR